MDTFSAKVEPIRFNGHADDQYSFLCNTSKISVMIDDYIWPTGEHYFLAQKIKDKVLRLPIKDVELHNLYSLIVSLEHREDWNKVKDNVMMTLLLAKFTQNTEIRDKLLETYPRELIYYSPDEYWGDGRDEIGENKLGRILMEIRKKLKDLIGTTELN
jgi:ribA/ribD-fused uncharacterized protein